MKNSSYWQKRFEALENARYTQLSEYVEIEKRFRNASSIIQSKIAYWYSKLAENNGISYHAAKKLLKSDELKEFKWTLEEYIEYGKKNAITGEWMKELENASAKVHINRLEAMQLEMRQQVESLYSEFEGLTSGYLSNVYSDSFYNTAYEIAKGTEIGTNLSKLDSDKIDKYIKKPWASDGNNFSSRIWTNKAKLLQSLNKELSQNIITGASPDRAIRNIANRMEVSRKQASRLLMTETAAIASMAQQDCFKELDIKQYEIVATLDTRTSEICRDMDGKVFDMKDYQVGVTAPPFHPYCRSCTCPYFEDNITERAYRDEDGNTSYVPGNMNYKEWYNSYVEKQMNNGIIKTDKQFGKKVGKHTKEYGLDPSKQSDREKMKTIIDDILVNHEEILQGNWRGQEGDVDFYIKGNDVVVVNGNIFVTILKGGIDNARVKNARKRKI